MKETQAVSKLSVRRVNRSANPVVGMLGAVLGACLAFPMAANADQIWLNCSLSISGRTFGPTGIPTDVPNFDGSTDGRSWADRITFTDMLDRGNPPKLFNYVNNTLYLIAISVYNAQFISWVITYNDPENNLRSMTATIDRVTMKATVTRAPQDPFWQLELSGNGTCNLINPLPVAQPKF
jgi:hypothetical protein